MHLLDDLSDWVDGLSAHKLLVRMAVILPLVALGLLFINHSVHVTCLRLHEQTGLETRVVGVMLPDCFVHDTDGMWRPADRLTSLEIDVF